MKIFGPRKSSLHLTTATVHDAHHLASLHGKSFAKGWCSQSFESLLSNKVNHCLLAHIAGNGTDDPVGFVLFRIAGGEAEIITICSDPEYRGSGIGRRLMVEALLKIRAERTGKLFLEVDEGNVPAVQLYKSLGMKMVSRRKGYYSNGNVDLDRETLLRPDALVMALELG